MEPPSVESLPVHSVGQALAFGRRADPALADGLKAILERRRKPEPFATPEQIKAQLEATVKAFLDGLKGKTSLDLAHAIADASKNGSSTPRRSNSSTCSSSRARSDWMWSSSAPSGNWPSARHRPAAASECRNGDDEARLGDRPAGRGGERSAALLRLGPRPARRGRYPAA